MLRIPSGVGGLDRLLGGGWAAGKVNLLYGPPASLKTMLVLATCKTFASRGGVAYFLDTEGKASPPRFRGLVHREASDIESLFDAVLEVKSRLRFLNPHLVLVAVDSLSAPFHALYLIHPHYASQRQSALFHLLNALVSQGATVLAVSWQSRNRYMGKGLSPAVVLRTERNAGGFRAVLEKSDGTLVGHEELDASEVASIAFS